MDEPAKKRIRMNVDGGSDQMGDKTGRVIAAVPERSVGDDAELGIKNETRKIAKVPKPREICDLSAQDYLTVSSKLTYRDKTVYLEDFFESGGSVMQTTAPSRMGKSTFMNTIHMFAQAPLDTDGNPVPNREETATYKMFMDKPIGKKHPNIVKAHCAKYPIISLDLKNVWGETKHAIGDKLKAALGQAYKPHGYLLERDDYGSVRMKNEMLVGHVNTFLKYFYPDRHHELTDSDLELGLSFLSEVLQTHYGQKVIILIDECDAPIMKAVTENMAGDNLDYMRNLLKEMTSSALKGQFFTAHVAKALMSGCGCISGVYSWDVNNRKDVLFLQDRDFVPVYGFTDKEVQSLFEDKTEFESVKDLDGLKKWYGNYTALGNKDVMIFNSYSVIKYVEENIKAQEKVFKSYWPNKGYVKILGKLFVRDEIQEYVEKLLDEDITIRTAEPMIDNILKLKTMIHDPEAELEEAQVHFFFQLLWDDGLLNAVEVSDCAVTLKIPNLETRRAIEQNCYTQSLFKTKRKLKPKNMNSFIKAMEQLLVQHTLDEEESQGEGNQEYESKGEENQEEESKGEGNQEYESRDDKDEKFQEFVNAVSILFSGDALPPENESELHHILYYLLYNSAIFNAQANRPIVTKISSVLNTDTESTAERRNPNRRCKTSHQKKRKETRGRKKEFDILITHGTAGMIIELKCCKRGDKEKSKEAFEQIKNCKYHQAFDNDEFRHIKRRIYCGLSFNTGANVTACYSVDSFEFVETRFVSSTDLKVMAGTVTI